MARVPAITSPCPLKWKKAPQPGMDFCGHCKRKVHNLDLMSYSERVTFLSGCKDKVCVSYTVKRVPIVPAIVGLSMAALAVTATAAEPSSITTSDGKLNWGPATKHECPTLEAVKANPNYVESEDDMLLGGVAAGDSLQWIDESELQKPSKEVLPDIDASEWMPTPSES